MKKTCLFLGCILVLLLLSGPVLAANTAKSLGMAGAVVAIGDDLSAPYINPAGLAAIKKNCAGISLSSDSVTWSGDYDASGSRMNLFENLGGAMPLGQGTLYAGSATLSWFFADVDNPGFGSDVVVDTWLNAPGVAYGIELMPGLMVGGGLNYLMYSSITDQPDTDNNVTYTGTGIGATLGTIYTAAPMINIGGSITLLGDVISTGKAKISSDVDIDRTNNSFPSTLRIGAAVKPMPGLTVSGQFDVLGAVNFEEKMETDLGDAVLAIRADSVVTTRLGVEFLAADGKVPLWAGVSFTPDNNGTLDPQDLNAEYIMFCNGGYVMPNTTTISLGAGYNEGPFSAGIAAQSSTGTVNIIGGDVTITDMTIIVSGSFVF